MCQQVGPGWRWGWEEGPWTRQQREQMICAPSALSLTPSGMDLTPLGQMQPNVILKWGFLKESPAGPWLGGDLLQEERRISDPAWKGRTLLSFLLSVDWSDRGRHGSHRSLEFPNPLGLDQEKYWSVLCPWPRCHLYLHRPSPMPVPLTVRLLLPRKSRREVRCLSLGDKGGKGEEMGLKMRDFWGSRKMYWQFIKGTVSQ